MNLGKIDILSFCFILLSLTNGLNGRQIGDIGEKSAFGEQETSKFLTKLALLDEIRSSELFRYANTNEFSSDLVEKAFIEDASLSSFKRLCTEFKGLAESANNARIYMRNAALIEIFFARTFRTEVFRTAVDNLSSRGLISSSNVFSAVKKLWFSDFSDETSVFRQRFCMLSIAKVEETMFKTASGNWLGYYLQKNKIPYNVNTDQDKQNVATEQRHFLIGKTPEFELAALTVCAFAQPQPSLQKVAANDIKRCRFTYDRQGHKVDAVVSTMLDVNEETRIVDFAWEFPETSDSNTDNMQISHHVIHDFPTVLESADESPKHKKKKKHNNTGTNDSELQGVVSQMWKLDENDRVDNASIIFNYGNHTDGNKDVSPSPFITWVNESFLEKPIYNALVNIYNASLFHPPVCKAEDSMTDVRRAALENFLNVVTNTTTFQTAYNFLKARNKTGSSYDEFYNTLFTLWFGTYSRCGSTLGSSGWEHVFSGEWKNNEIVDGHHSWIRYYLGQKEGKINYHGYYSYVDGIIATIQYTWSGYMKKIGGFLLRSSPAFDFSLFTVCSLTHTGEEKCKFKIQGNDLFVTSFTQSCDAGRCLSTSFPGMK